MSASNSFHKLVITALLIISNVIAHAQSTGKVVINEYMNWPSAGCGVTSEYVELYNIGPGPVNIGCYILTDGDFSVTIPAGTILQSGQYYIISGRATIAAGCADDVSTVTVNLNWTTCGCTNAAIPVTGDGFFTDGGSANEPIVLLSSTGQVLDAVTQSAPGFETSANITSSTVGSTCTAVTFDLDLLGITYETIGISGGRGNSFTRNIDGECGSWGKETQQNGGETNNSATDVPLWNMSAITAGASACGVNDGAAIISLTQPGGATFPMNYTLAFDVNNNNLFEASDTYTAGTDNTTPAINLSGLASGKYRITVSDNGGCFYQALSFTIACGSLAIRLSEWYITSNGNSNTLRWNLENSTDIQTLAVEKSSNGTNFYVLADDRTNNTFLSYLANSFTDVNTGGGVSYYRLRITEHSGKIEYLPILRASSAQQLNVYPNPAQEKIYISTGAGLSNKTTIRIYDIKGRFCLSSVNAAGYINISTLINGLYYAELVDNDTGTHQRILFLKQ
jgi:Lamin Tail Domain/Secretion system C-terminal sorting domain